MNILTVCTGRHNHPVRRLGWLLAEHRDGVREIVCVPWAPGRKLVDADRPTLHGTLRIPPCPTCRRTVPMRQETAAHRYDALAARGITTLDVSMV